jgi:uncharacterized protein (TIGR00290 family)
LKEKAIFNWSGGKDSALCLYKLLAEKKYELLCLLTSVSRQYQRITMHGVRVELLEKQAESIGLPLVKMEIPEMPTMEVYELAMAATMEELKRKGATVSVFGDIFLEDLRKYREDKLSQAGLKGLFPLWKMDTRKVVEEFIRLGFKTIVICVNEKYLDKSFSGRIIDEAFLNDLPPGVDPAGENGEFHTFVFDGPIFKTPVRFKLGETVYRKYTKPEKKDASYDCGVNDKNDDPFDTGFWYCDLLPG